nr:heavy metal-binding domain-containing protein [Biomaibacter acetigenes]
MKRFNEAREEALKEMEERAANLGANAVIGVDEIGEVDEMMKKTIKEIVDEQRG